MRKPPHAPKPSATRADSQSAELFQVYKDHSNVLRGWLTAYGVGVPVLLLSQDKLWEKFSHSGSLRDIALLFLGGVGLQAALAALNKYVTWSCYYGEIHDGYKAGYLYKISNWIARQAWIDLVVDLLAIAAFAWGTYRCFMSLISVPQG